VWLHIETTEDGVTFNQIADGHYYPLSTGNIVESYLFELPQLPQGAAGQWRFKVEQDSGTNPVNINASCVTYNGLATGITTISQYDLNNESRGFYEPAVLVSSAGLNVKSIDKPGLFMGDTYNVAGNGTIISQTYAFGVDDGTSVLTGNPANSYSVSARLKTGIGAAVKFFVEAKTRTNTWSVFAESPVITVEDQVWNSPVLPVKRGEVRVRTVSSNAVASVIDFNVVAYSGSVVHNATVTAGSAVALPTDNALVVSLREPITGNTNLTVPLASFTKLTDGTNNAVISPASTTPAGTVPALVTVNSPNSPEVTSIVPSVVASRAVLGAARYVLTPPTLTDLQQNSLRLDNRGALVVGQDKVTVRVGQINPTADTALTAGKKVYRVVLTNNSASIIYLQFHNTALAIVAGTAPSLGMVFRVPANSTFVLDETTFGDGGELISANTRIGLSSTFGTYTAVIAGTLAQMALSVKLEA
jgi:hypothetical protein